MTTFTTFTPVGAVIKNLNKNIMENLDLTQILKDCPKGTKLYSPMVGFVTYEGITDGEKYTVVVKEMNGWEFRLTKDGKYEDCEWSECMLFPSRENRDWSTFKVGYQEIKKAMDDVVIEKIKKNLFEPFQRVLVRDVKAECWQAQIYSHYRSAGGWPHCCINNVYAMCIPYEGNEHLLGTTDEPKTKDE